MHFATSHQHSAAEKVQNYLKGLLSLHLWYSGSCLERAEAEYEALFSEVLGSTVGKVEFLHLYFGFRERLVGYGGL